MAIDRQQGQRVHALDVTRGIAMLGVILSHSAQFVRGNWPDVAWVMTAVGMVATPTFLLLSGLLVGRQWATRPMTTNEDLWRTMDRALFLLVVLHLILGLTESLWRPWREALLGNFYITDAIGAALLLGTLYFRQRSVRALIVAGCLLASSTSVLLLLSLHGNPELALAEWVLFGIQPSDIQISGYVVPLVPYLGVFLLGAAMGRYYAANDTAPDVMLRIGMICMASAITLKLSWVFAIKAHIPESMHLAAYHVLEPTQKIPPSIAYFLAFAGCGAFISGLVHRLPHVMAASRGIEAIGVIGRSSLAVFVAQYWVIYPPVKLMGFDHIGWLIIPVFAAIVTVLWYVALVWDRCGGNRYLKFSIARKLMASRGACGTPTPTT